MLHFCLFLVGRSQVLSKGRGFPTTRFDPQVSTQGQVQIRPTDRGESDRKLFVENTDQTQNLGRCGC